MRAGRKTIKGVLEIGEIRVLPEKPFLFWKSLSEFHSVEYPIVFDFFHPIQ
jgi:hypothetical protein